MPNLYKQYTLTSQEKAVRIINSNAAVEARIAELQRKLQESGTESESGFVGGFTQGITAERVEIIPEETPEEVLAQARQEAEAMVENARRQSEEMIAQALKQAADSREEANRQGYTDGYEQGKQQAKVELEEEYAAKNEALDKRQETLEQEYQAELAYLEPKLLDVILQVINKVFHVEFDDKRGILLYLIQNTIMNIEGSNHFRIRVGDAQRFFLENHKEELIEHVGKDITVDIAADALLDGDDCIIETDTGIFECGLGVQFENLIKDLKALTM